MAEIDKTEIEKLRKLGAMETTRGGEEGVRLTAQFRGAPSTPDRKAWKETLEQWERRLDEKIRPFGAATVDGSLSTSGQSVELVVPVKDLDAAVKALSDDDIGLRLSRERKVDPKY